MSLNTDSIGQQRTEIALRESHMRFGRLIEEMSDGYCLIQGNTIALGNSRAAEMFGYTQEQVSGKSILNFLPLNTIRQLARVKINSERVDGFIRLSFSDDGPGISKENLDHIFDPFFTTKEVGKVTGLGLSICYGILQAHGGHICVSSDLGKGATFTVEIPAASGDKPVATQIDLTEAQGVPALKWTNS